MFLHVCVILFTGGVSRQGEPPGQREPPWQGEPPLAGRTPPDQADTPPPRTRRTPPLNQADPPTQEADSRIRFTSGRYASNWNAFLLCENSHLFVFFSGLVDSRSATQLHFMLATCGNDNLVKLWDVLAYSGSASK